MKFIANNLEVAINVPNGIWLLDDDSAAGKTLLKKCVQSLESVFVNKYYTYSYEDYAKGTRIPTSLPVSKPELVVLDRYDLYAPYGLDMITELAKFSRVFIDCKQLGKIATLDFDYCFLRRTKSTLEVYT